MFTYYNITYKRSSQDWIVVNGEIKNDSRRNYETALFRLIIYDRKKPIGMGFFRVHSFRMKSLKNFEVLIFGLHYRFIPHIARYEVILESGY